jgi:ABC-type nitrate/sulfonate/bicarbonate transport system ATPase subunit
MFDLTSPASNTHTPSASIKLQVQNLGKVFKYSRQELVVLDNINLHLDANEFVCLVGASGCGKSTLLKIIAGLEQPSTGVVTIDGAAVVGPGADRGMVFQNYTLFPWRSVADNIGFGLELKGQNKLDRREQIAYYLDVVGLTRFADAYPKQLSGGMKQRVAIARALANQPSVLLMDEPFGALDAQTKEQMQQFMQQLQRNTHIAVLMVTHDVEEAIFLSQRVYVMGSHPGSIKAEIAIDLPVDRDLKLKLEPEFVQIKRQILETLGD